MNIETKQEVIRLLIADAVEASKGSYAEAACLLSETLISIILTRHQGAAAVEVAMMLAGGMVDHIKTFSGFASPAVMEVVASGDADAIAVADNLESDRLSVMLAGGTPFDEEGMFTNAARDCGSLKAWEDTAHGYCMAALCGTQGGTRGGRVIVSAAGLGLLLGLTERWGIAAGAIPPQEAAE